MKKSELLEKIQKTIDTNKRKAKKSRLKDEQLDEQFFCGRFSALEIVKMIIEQNKIEEDEEC